MVKPDEIRDQDALVEWIQWRSADEAVVLTQRAVCRVLPLYGRAMREPWALDANLTALPLLRLNLTGVATARARPMVRLPSPPPDSAAMKKASNAARGGGSPELAFIPDVTLGAADVAFGARSDAIKLRDTVAKVVGYTARAATDAERIWEQIREDARTLERDADLSGAPLWLIPQPDWFREADAAMRALWQADPAYAFWLRWWDGVLSGNQIDWALQETVALIPDEVWQQGAEAVAAEIARIEEQLRLLREVERLKKHLASARSEIAALSRRGHNNPPELVEPVAEIERRASEISKSLEEAAQELKSEAPRPSVLRRVGRALLHATAKSLTYCASLGDVALRSTAVAAGTAAGPILVATLTGHWQEVQSFAQALLAFARSLGGG